MPGKPSEKARELRNQYEACYGRPQINAETLVNLEVCGPEAEGVHSYTTTSQVEGLVTELALGPKVRLLDIGSGRGWPGVYLARLSGCEAFLTDVPAAGLVVASERALREGVEGRTRFVRASGTDLPFRARTFDAVVHTDVL